MPKKLKTLERNEGKAPLLVPHPEEEDCAFQPAISQILAEQTVAIPGHHYTLVSRKKCTNPCSCETIVCTIPVASAAWCDRQA